FWDNLGRHIWNNSMPVNYTPPGPSDFDYATLWNNSTSELDYFIAMCLKGYYTKESIEDMLGDEGNYNDGERAKSQAFKAAVITDIEAYLDYYRVNGLDSNLDNFMGDTFDGGPYGSLYAYLNSQSIQTVTLSEGDVDALIAYLESVDLHFGRSAYDSLIALLGKDPDPATAAADRLAIAKAVIILEVLLGLLNPYRQQKTSLIISMYTLSLIAGAEGVTVGGYDLLKGDTTFETAMAWLKWILQNKVNSYGIIIYTEDGHFVTVIGVDATVIDPETLEEVG
ncbi:unnamed protein product, partial [marine sediment metagenome]